MTPEHGPPNYQVRKLERNVKCDMRNCVMLSTLYPQKRAEIVEIHCQFNWCLWIWGLVFGLGLRLGHVNYKDCKIPMGMYQ